MYSRQVKKLHAVMMRHQRSIIRITFMAKVKNKEILERTSDHKESPVDWTPHADVTRQTTKAGSLPSTSSGHRKRGRPRLRFKET